MLSDLRESGATSRMPTYVAFIYRDDYYNPDTEDKNIAEIIIATEELLPSELSVLRGCWSIPVSEMNCVKASDYVNMLF